MRMIPDTPHGTRSPAEKRVFDLLRAAFADQPESVGTARAELEESLGGAKYVCPIPKGVLPKTA